MIIIKTEKRLIEAQMEMYDMLDSIDPSSLQRKPLPNKKIEHKPVPAPVASPVTHEPAAPSPVAPPVAIPAPAAVPTPAPVVPENQLIPPGPINNIFSEILQRMGVDLNEKKGKDEEGKQLPRTNTNQNIPDDLLEKMLSQPMGSSTVENTLSRSIPSNYEEYKGVPMTREFIKGFIGMKIKSFLTRQRDRNWDFNKYLQSTPQKFMAKDEVKAPGWLKEIVSRIDEVNKKGMPDYVKSLYPMPSKEVLDKHPMMAKRIEAERITEAFRFYNWENGQPKVDASGRPLRAGEPGTRTHKAINELNRTFKALDTIRTPNWTPMPKTVDVPHELSPFGGVSSYGNKGMPFNQMKEVMQKAVAQNEADGGQTEASINAELAKQNQPPITLDKKRWAKNGDLYVNNEMVNPSKIGRDPQHILKALMQRKDSTKSFDMENSDGDKVFDTETGGNVRDTFDESDLDEDSKITGVANPYALVSKPYISGTPSNNAPLKKKYTYPMVARETVKHMGGGGEIPQDEKGLRDFVKSHFRKKIADAEGELANVEEKPENMNHIEDILSRINKYKEYNYNAGSATIDELQQAAKALAGGTVDNKTVEKMLHAFHDMGIKPSDFSGEKGAALFPEAFKKLQQDNSFSHISEQTAKNVFDNIGKTFRNLGKAPLGPDMAAITLPVIDDLKKSYDDAVASFSSLDNKNTTQKTSEMEARVKSKILDLLARQTNDKKLQQADTDKELLNDPEIAQLLMSNYTNHELSTGRTMLSRNNDLVHQRLHQLVMEVSNEVLRHSYEKGKNTLKEGKPILEASLLRKIRVAMFLNKNRAYGI